MTSTWSTSGMISSRTAAEVAGLIATPTRFPNALMRCTVRDRSLLPSQWTKNELVPASRKLVDEKIGIRDHQVRLQRQARHPPQRADDRRSHRKIGHEMSVHHVDVDAVRSGTLSLGHLIAQRAKSAARIDGASFTASGHVAPLSLR